VRFRAEFPDAGDALVFTSGSALREDVKSPGYFVFAPAHLPGGQKVVVNRGYVPGRPYPRPAGAVDIVGYLRGPRRFN
jgi:cytochrome oxidase assembly protein ShyY1